MKHIARFRERDPLGSGDERPFAEGHRLHRDGARRLANRAAKAHRFCAIPSEGYTCVGTFSPRAHRHSIGEQIADASIRPRSTQARVVNVEHHLAHLASSYYCPPSTDLTRSPTTPPVISPAPWLHAARARESRSKSACIYPTASDSSTRRLPVHRLRPFGEEYKVMGLAPYGEEQPMAMQCASLVLLPEKGMFKLADGYFGMHDGGESGGSTSTASHHGACTRAAGEAARQAGRAVASLPSARRTLPARSRSASRRPQFIALTVSMH